MRVIGGEHRGRTILGPKDAEVTRPITDRVKTTLFDRLCQGMHLLGVEDEPDGVVLDVFSGTGTLGIEALSRGAERVAFVEQHRDALKRLEQNLQTLGLEDRADVLNTSALRPGWIEHLPAAYQGRVRVTFFDPPYAMLKEPEGWARLLPVMEAAAKVTEPGGVMVLRTERRVDVPEVAGWEGPEGREYGSMVVNYFYKSEVRGPESEVGE